MLYELNCSACNGFQIPFDEGEMRIRTEKKAIYETNEKEKISTQKELLWCENICAEHEIAVLWDGMRVCLYLWMCDGSWKWGSFSCVYKYGDQ